MDIKVIAVVGGGTMGHGIAQVALQAGFQVLLEDVAKEILEKAKSRITFGLAKGVEKGKLTEAQKGEMLKNLTLTTALSDCADADFVIEAVAENFSVKKGVFEELDRVCRPEVILATNTSSISITKIASTTSAPSRVVGMHFFNPVPIMRLVEIIPGFATEEKTVAVTHQLAQRIADLG
jgi:3-hydroxybutyryl-CoA dehydrogenase